MGIGACSPAYPVKPYGANSTSSLSFEGCLSSGSAIHEAANSSSLESSSVSISSEMAADA